MIRYATYDPATGAIIRVGHCQPGDLALQAPCVVSDDADDTAHYIHNGQVLDLPPRPSRLHSWGGHGIGWVDLRSIEDMRRSAWEQVKIERAEQEAAPFDCLGHTFDADQARLMGAAIDAMLAKAAGQTWEQQWTLTNNTMVALSADEMILVARTLKERVSALWTASQAMREQIINASNPDELAAAVQWPSP